jgi:hypothetical protein
MARLARPGARTAGLYKAVIEAHERQLEIHAANRIPALPVIAERLELLRSGASVWVPAHYLPEGARPRLVAGRPGLRALVTPEGVASLRSKTAAEWLAENRL